MSNKGIHFIDMIDYHSFPQFFYILRDSFTGIHFHFMFYQEVISSFWLTDFEQDMDMIPNTPVLAFISGFLVLALHSSHICVYWVSSWYGAWTPFVNDKTDVNIFVCGTNKHLYGLTNTRSHLNFCFFVSQVSITSISHNVLVHVISGATFTFQSIYSNFHCVLRLILFA